MRWLAFLFACVLTVNLAGCPSHTLLTVQDQQKIQSNHQDKSYYLKQSFFIGPFFAYDDRMYISERGFDERVLIESPGGDPILTSEPTGVLPMGTSVKVQQIEFPTSSAISDRKLKSPRHFTWVTLNLADKPRDKPYVLVFTNEFRKIPDFERALEAFLVKEDPRPQFEGLSDEIKAAIERKSLAKGMRADALLRSRGHPDKVSRKVEEGVRVEKWQYAGDRVVLLKDDTVESWEGFPSLDLELVGKTPDKSPEEGTPPPPVIKEDKPEPAPSSTESP